MELSKLTRQREIDIRAIHGSQNVDLSDPQYDSRNITPGSCFFAIRGFAQDGHTYISQALAQGANCIFLEDESFIDPSAAITWCIVANGRKALAIVSEEIFSSPSSKLTLIGVTGTNGKTTTTNLIKQLLEWRGEKVGLIGTLGVWIGDRFIEGTHTTPESRDISALLASMVNEQITTCIIEVSSHAVALDRITGLDFDIAVFTNLTQDHLDFHKSFDDYAKAKQQFFTSLKNTAIAITNADDPHGAFMVEQCDATSYSYGIYDQSAFGQADITAEISELTLQHTTFEVKKRYSEERAQFTTKLVGSFNVANVLAAASALYFGIPEYSLEVLAEAVQTLHPVRGRFEQIDLPGGALAVIDYAHTPDALENLITAASTIAQDIRKIITVFGCGGDRDRTKRPLMGSIASALSDSVVVTSDNPRTEDPVKIIEDIVKGIPEDKRAAITIEADREKAIETGLSLAGANDIVLIAGKGHEDYQIINNVKKPFDDKAVVLRWASKQI